jgi:predicted ATP-grasp superfamily ATP-dependent carboligase
MEKVGAVVVGVDNPSGIELLTSFKMNGIPAVAIDTKRHALGFYSRHRDRSFLSKSSDEKGVVDAILSLGTRLRNWVLIPNTDYFATIVSRNHKILSECFVVATANWDSARYCVDKSLTYEAARKAVVPVPKTFCPNSRSELEETVAGIELDVAEWILKPRWRDLYLDGKYGGFSRRVFKNQKARSGYSKESMLDLSLRACLDSGVFPMIQERMPGGPDLLSSAIAVVDKDLNPIALCPSRKIRQNPRDFGVNSYAESIDDGELVGIFNQGSIRLFNQGPIAPPR